MAWKFHTDNVTLHVKTQTGVDAFNVPVYADDTAVVTGILIGRPESEDEARAIDLYGKRIEYSLGIPKGDAHDWENAVVEFWGQKFRTFGFTKTANQANVPGPWGCVVMVERYE